MDLTTVTPADFKAQFPKDFPYLPEYSNVLTYNTGGRVYYSVTGLFYDCISDGTTGVLPTVGANWTALNPSVDNISNYVLDSEINGAFLEAQLTFNQSLVVGTDAQITLVYLYLTAHYLTHDIRASGAGAEGKGASPLTGRSVGSVSESYSVPDAYTQNAQLAFYADSTYGIKYLSLIYSCLRGNFGVVGGGTLP